MAITSQLELNGLTAEKAFDLAVNKGLSKNDAALLVSGWIFENFGKTKRVFNYAQSFPAVDPACVASFARTFAHDDWVDGESVVQAEQTAGEEGFNARFHKIETDLDALGADVAKSFTCLAEMRQELRTLLDEVRAEINRLNSDVFECCNKSGGGVGPVAGVDQLANFGGLVKNSKFLGATNLADKTVSLWQTEQGVMVLPAVQTIGVEVVTDNRIKSAAGLARYIEENADVRNFFRDQPITKDMFAQKFGNDFTRDGQNIREVLNILPGGTRFETLEQMVDVMAERQAAALRTTAGANAAIAQAFGLETDVQRVGETSIDRVDIIPARTRSILISNGIDTMDKLAQTDAAKMSRLLTKEGVENTVGQVREWTVMAKTLNLTR